MEIRYQISGVQPISTNRPAAYIVMIETCSALARSAHQVCSGRSRVIFWACCKATSVATSIPT